MSLTTRTTLGARERITPPHTPANCRGLGPATNPFHLTGKSGPAGPHAGPRWQVAGSGGGSKSHPPPVPIAANLRTPSPGWTAEKRCYRNPLAITWRPRTTNCLLPLLAAPLSALPPAPPPPAPASFAQPRPFPAESPRLRTATSALPPSRALPGEEWGRRRRLEKSMKLRRKERRQRAGPEAPEPRLPATPQSGRGKWRRQVAGSWWATLTEVVAVTERRLLPPVRIGDVEEHGVVGPVPEGGRGWVRREQVRGRGRRGRWAGRARRRRGGLLPAAISLRLPASLPHPAPLPGPRRPRGRGAELPPAAHDLNLSLWGPPSQRAGTLPFLAESLPDRRVPPRKLALPGAPSPPRFLRLWPELLPPGTGGAGRAFWARRGGGERASGAALWFSGALKLSSAGRWLPESYWLQKFVIGRSRLLLLGWWLGLGALGEFITCWEGWGGLQNWVSLSF